jgi:flagellar motility protein MotE (MotC chaperone)
MASVYKIAFFFLIGFLSCKKNVDIDNIVSNFSSLECKAVQLKNKRFALFERLRVIELDTVANKIELDSLHKIIAYTKAESLQIADSIRRELDFLFSNVLVNKEDKEDFNEKLRSVIENCK